MVSGEPLSAPAARRLTTTLWLTAGMGILTWLLNDGGMACASGAIASSATPPIHVANVRLCSAERRHLHCKLSLGYSYELATFPPRVVIRRLSRATATGLKCKHPAVTAARTVPPGIDFRRDAGRNRVS